MKFIVVGLRDKVAGSFQGINLDVNEAVAKRNFSFAVNNSNELLFKAKDLELYIIGEFESESGVYLQKVPMVRICSGDEVVKND